MQAGPLPPSEGLLITMLDGGLGAVAGSSDATVAVAEKLCWCDCIICGAPSVIEA